MLIIKALYERDEDINVILSQCHNFDVYMSRKKIAHASVVKSCSNFTKFVRKMLHPNAKRDKKKILNELDDMDLIAYKIWLKAKINSL